MDRHKFILTAVIVIGLMILAGAMALGKVEEKTSYGLTNVLLLLNTIIYVLHGKNGPPSGQ